MAEKEGIQNLIAKGVDCTKHFTHMVKEFSESGIDRRDHPTQQDEVPDALDQKGLMVDKIKEQREALEKHSIELRVRYMLSRSEGPKVSKDSLLKIMRDIDSQD